MITTVSIHDIYKIINLNHSDPHSILGMHKVDMQNGRSFMAVRVFIPGASEILVYSLSTKKLVAALSKIHQDGFFEGICPGATEWFPYYLKIKTENGNVWETPDPYEFSPSISEYDRYLFCAGNHYNVYDMMGSHPMEKDGVQGVSFTVWAPSAKSVSLIGSFNDWDGRRHQMRLLPNCGIWEIFMPNLQEGDIYKFEIRTQTGDTLIKTDPYGNYFELRPNTAAVVWDINKYQWSDKKWMEHRSLGLDKPMNIYEVHAGSWAHIVEDGYTRPMTYRELASKLIPYLKEMSYTHVELLPITEYPFDGSWGYQVTGYYAPTSRYGTPEDLMYFIDKCHKNGIGVILDWVPAHFPKDAFSLGRFDGTALYEHLDPRQGEHPDWGTYIYNYGRKEVQNFLIGSALFWIEKYHADGLRVDAVASMLYLDYGKSEGGWVPNYVGGRENLEAVEFLKHLNSIISKKYHSVHMIAEESTSWPKISASPEDGGLGFTLKWNMGWMNDILEYIKTDPLFRKYHHNNITFSMIYAYSEKFVLVFSHDEVVHMKGSLIGKMPGDIWQKFANLRVLLGYMMTHPGKKLLFMGGEFGQFAEWNETRSLDWHLLQYDNHRMLQDYVKNLNKLYTEEPALWELDFSPEGFSWTECNDAEKSVITYTRRSSSGEKLLCAVNFTPETYDSFKIGVDEAGIYQEIFNSDNEAFGGSGKTNPENSAAEAIPWNFKPHSINITLPPLGIAIFKQIPKK